MAFDEYGGLDPEAESFDSFAQYMDSGSKKAPDFYTGASIAHAMQSPCAELCASSAGGAHDNYVWQGNAPSPR